MSESHGEVTLKDDTYASTISMPSHKTVETEAKPVIKEETAVTKLRLTQHNTNEQAHKVVFCIAL